VVEESGYVIEQLSTSYPYKKAWRWTGHRWNTANSTLGESYLPIAVGIVIVLVIVWLPLALHSPTGPNIIFWALLAVLLAVLPALMVWLAYRR
jgi:multidrug efflux pump subunit AcrB